MGRRPIIMLEETGTPYNITAIDPHAPESKADAYLKISPGGKVPCLVDPDAEGGEPITLMESGAILLYLSEKAGQFGGDTARQRWEVRQWLLYGATNVAISFSALNVTRDMEKQCRDLLSVTRPAAGRGRIFRRRIFHRRHDVDWPLWRFPFRLYRSQRVLKRLPLARPRSPARPAVKKAMEMKIT